MTTLLLDLAGTNLLVFAMVVLAALLIAREIGYALGVRRARSAEAEGAGTALLVGAILALLAFVLALTLSFSSTRFQERRAATLGEANAIGTAWLRSQAIDHPRAAEIARLLETYAGVRADFVAAPRGAPGMAEIEARSAALQGEMWGHLAALVRERPDPVTATLMSALNEVFDRATAERFVFHAPLPPSLAWLLLVLAALGMGGVGYQLGLRQRPHRVLSLALTALWTIVIVQILDLGAPRLGALRSGTLVYEWAIESFQGGIRIPPLPR